MDKKECYYLGFISKTVGFKGEVVLTLDTDETEYYEELESIYVEINRKLVPFFLERFINRKQNHLRVKLEGIDTEEDAKSLLKKQLFLPLSYLPKLSGTKFYYHEIIGFQVIDEEYGDCGIICDIIDNTSNPIIQVMKDDIDILIPLQDDFIKQVDRKGKKLYVKTPPGLIALYLGQ
ncbi:MAG: ribosome maturation factor RimM [Flavobacteriales bacterium]